jgi:hypothetical protein
MIRRMLPQNTPEYPVHNENQKQEMYALLRGLKRVVVDQAIFLKVDCLSKNIKKLKHCKNLKTPLSL